MLDKNDDKETIEISKDILKDINKNDPFLDYSIPTDQIISDIFDHVDLTDNKVTIENATDDEIFNDKVAMKNVTDNEIFNNKVTIASDNALSTDKDIY